MAMVKADKAVFAWAALTILCAGCHRSSAVIPAPKAQQVELATQRGTASVRFITEKRTLGPGQEFQPPRPRSPLALPEYPAAALAAHAGDATVVLRFIIDAEGNVTDVRESPRAVSMPAPYAELFRAASEEAVRSWKYIPAELEWVEPGTDINGDGKPDFRRVVRRETIPVYLDVQFEFHIESGKPQVR